MKKFIIALVVFLLVGCSKVEPKPLLEFLNKDFDLNDVTSVEYVRYTEGGDNRVIYTEKNDIERLYNAVKDIKIGKETSMACEDNTTVYIFNMKDNKTVAVEIECDWVVIGNTRYEIVKD